MRYRSAPVDLIPKATAVWAFSESGLGGVLHALKVPFSGIALGGIAVILITFLAANSVNKWKTILQAMALVLMLKAMISPHSPPMAYVAVGFQGVLGAAVYQTFGVGRVSAMAFGAIALLESAFQKVLTLTVIFGVQIWDAFSTFFEGLTQTLGIAHAGELPIMVLAAYGLLYAVAGALAGHFAVGLPRNIKATAKSLNALSLSDLPTGKPSAKRRNRSKKLLVLLGVLVFAVGVFLFSGHTDKVWYILWRTTVVVFLFLFVVNPLVKYLIHLWVKKRQSKNRGQLDRVMAFLPGIKKNTSLAYRITVPTKNPVARTRKFLLVWLTLSLYFEDE